MKARVIETGQIEEFQVNELNDYFTKDGVHYKGLELDFDFECEPGYWEKLKHQAAIVAMQGIMTNIVGFESVRTQVNANEVAAGIAKDYATALVNRLKEESQCEK